MPEYQKEPTPIQRVMKVLMGIAFAALLAWTGPELVGVFSPESEDTWTEYVTDLDFGWVLAISGIHVVAGVLLVGSAWHFLENYFRRRKEEQERIRSIGDIEVTRLPKRD